MLWIREEDLAAQLQRFCRVLREQAPRLPDGGEKLRAKIASLDAALRGTGNADTPTDFAPLETSEAGKDHLLHFSHLEGLTGLHWPQNAADYCEDHFQISGDVGQVLICPGHLELARQPQTAGVRQACSPHRHLPSPAGPSVMHLQFIALFPVCPTLAWRDSC